MQASNPVDCWNLERIFGPTSEAFVLGQGAVSVLNGRVEVLDSVERRHFADSWHSANGRRLLFIGVEDHSGLAGKVRCLAGVMAVTLDRLRSHQVSPLGSLLDEVLDWPDTNTDHGLPG